MIAPARARLRELAAHPSLKGIAIQRCVAGWRWQIEPGAIEVGHIHFGPPRRAWICLSSGFHFNATTLCHEIAHLLCGNMRHDDRWRRAVHSLGGRVERKYRKVKR